MTKTIEIKFDASTLPKWAQNDARVVELCKRDLSFRANVCSATTTGMRNFAKREAARRSR